MSHLLSPQHKYDLSLPKINFKKNKTSRSPQKQDHLGFTNQQYSQELSKLDDFGGPLPTLKRKRTMASESILFLYKNNNKLLPQNKFPQYQELELSSSKMYLTHLQSELSKIRKINYEAIFQNVEYCAGIYEITFNSILKKIESIKSSLEKNLDMKLKAIQEMRKQKINEMIAKRQSQSVMLKKGETDQRTLQSKIHIKQQFFQNISQQQHLQARYSGASDYSSQFQIQAKEKQNESLIKSMSPTKIAKEDSKSYYRMCMNDQIKREVSSNVIEQKEQQLEPLKKLLIKTNQAKMRVLCYSLQLGYDIRNQGLLWILKEINECHQNQPTNWYMKKFDKENQIPQEESEVKEVFEEKYIPKVNQFPSFLSSQEINFIISKFKNDFKLKVLEEQKDFKQEQQRSILQQAFENVRRDRNRKISMIKQKQLLQRMLKHKQTTKISGHKYLTEETIKLMQSCQKLKSTTNQLIYQETVRKLNKFCVQEIYGQKNKNMGSNSNEQVNKLMGQVKKMLAHSNKIQKYEQQIKTQQEKELSDILMKLRNQIFEGKCSEKRNPISVIGCLVGCKKAKKILQSEMNISMPASE